MKKTKPTKQKKQSNVIRSKKPKQSIKQPRQLNEKDIDKIELDCARQKEKTEELISDKGWNAYVDKCVDIIYFNFNNFGWTYGVSFLELTKPVTRDDIEDNIINLIGESIKGKTQIESGRIAVDVVDDQLWIAMTL